MKSFVIRVVMGLLLMVPGGAEAEWEKYLAVAGDNAAEISTFVNAQFKNAQSYQCRG